ncbi:MAG TPA: beta-ketoacyl-[acyl-carrier-protein] synthase family protein, partial [Bryobacteraceae bacterium]|nr:beta-ketoacyl-[acyl-carrier-protein] synthase family protein [Bryobacteraceae bacterium]
MRRVAVTGIGVVSSIGTGRDAFWKALLAGQTGISPVALFDTTAFPVHIGGEVKDFDALRYLSADRVAGTGRATQMAIAAARLAVADGALDISTVDPARFGVSMGTTSGEPLFVEQYNDAKKAGGEDAIPGEAMGRYPCHTMPAHVAQEFGAHGPVIMIPTACAAGNYAIGYGFDLIRTGRVDLVLAGGADAFSRITYTGFARLGAIAPAKCQPFDKNRKGMVPGEGSGMLMLEPLDSAVARGAKIYAEVLGYGVSCDAHHMTAAHPAADGAIRCMSNAMKEAGVGPGDIDYISAHGTGTPTNDRLESLAVRTLFGENAPKVPMSSIKSMLGHTMGAASAIEAAACSLALDTGWIPATMNHEEADPDCGLDIVPNQARQTNPRIVLNNAYAFGG